MKFLVKIVLIFITALETHGQGVVNSFSNAGSLILATDQAHIGIIGQPLIGPFSGMLLVSNIMYGNDRHPPVITFNPGTLSIKLQQENSLTYMVTDNDQVVSSKVYYRPIGFVGDFQSIDVTPGLDNTFAKSIASSWFDQMGMEYYLEAKDKKNTARHPVGEGTHVAFTINSTPQIPTTLLSYGKTKKNYRIISLPYETNSPITQVFEELGPSDKIKYRIYKYEGGAFKEYPSFTTIARGDGYFIIMSDVLSDVVLSMPEMQSPQNDQSNLYSLTLKPGWNLIGNPYTIDINWDDLLAFNANPAALSPNLKIWTGEGQYTNVKELKAYQGAFVWLDGSQPLTVLVPFKGQQPNVSGGRKKDEGPTNSTKDAWHVDLILEEGEETNLLGGFGMRGDANNGFDRFDDIDPPSLDNFLTLKFLHPEHDLQYFVRDVVPPQPKHVWNLEIPSTVGKERSLRWSSLNNVGSDLILYDASQNQVIDMKTQTSYRFSSSSQNFRIFFGPAEQNEIYPEQVTVVPPFPNPVSRGQTLKFSIGLPPFANNYTLQLDLFDAMGNTIYQNTWIRDAGIHEINLPAQSIMPRGAGELVYYHLQIGRSQFSGKLIFRP